MDEKQLAELFRGAADGGPPASFEHHDVVAASRRLTARRRLAIATGSAVGIAVLVGSMVVSGFLRDSDRGGELAATAGSGGSAQPNLPVPADQRGQPPAGPLAEPSPTAVDKSGPGALAEQGRAASGKVVPWPGLRDDDARAECGPVDRELVNDLIGEFPATPTAPQPVPDLCPPGSRAASVPVAGGVIYVVLAPVRGDGPADQLVTRADGAYGYAVHTPEGSVLLVLSVPAAPGAPAPYADRTQRAAETIAQRH